MRTILDHIKYKILVYPAAYLLKALMKILFKTCKIEVRDIENLIKATEGKQPCVLVLWHNRLTILPEFLSSKTTKLTFKAIISNSRDGHLLAVLTESYRRGRTLRVPHNKRFQALRQITADLQKGDDVIVITPDGPRGPRYSMKPGILLMAKETGAHLIPFSWSASKFWQLKSWDKMIFPKPFSKIVAGFGQAMSIEGALTIEEQISHLNRQMTHFDESICQLTSVDKEKWPK